MSQTVGKGRGNVIKLWSEITCGSSIQSVKVVDSCWISSTEWSDTFRRFFVYGKKQESRIKMIYIMTAKKFHLSAAEEV